MFNFLNIKKFFTKPSVSVLLPAYQAQSFVCETLDSLNNQTFLDFRLYISVDKSDDDTARVVKKWCKAHQNIRSKIFYQKHRLGWVKNINFLLKKCRTKYFMVLPHDDLIDKTYLARMVECLTINKNACTAFSDLKGFGTLDPLIIQNTLVGNRLDRVFDFLNYHYCAVAFRGLVNRSVLSDLLLIPDKGDANFSMDTLWNMQMAIKGDMIRIPEVLYHKRYLDNSAHDRWQTGGREEKVKAWLGHCANCIELINRIGFDQDDIHHLLGAVKSRLLQQSIPLWAYAEISNLNQGEKASLVEALFGNSG